MYKNYGYTSASEHPQEEMSVHPAGPKKSGLTLQRDS